jgi:DNA-binding transcriptional LysR family regulator
MSTPDMNLLVTLDVLLEEGSVAGAARRLRLSASAMSRALTRLRETVGDPLLVRAGRGLVPTPRAVALRERVGPLVQEARAVLGPAEALDPARLTRAFTLRTTEGFVESFGPALLARTQREAPGVQLRFLPKADKDARLLREGVVDLETGVVDPGTSPELRTQALFRDRYVGAVRAGHALARAGSPSRASWRGSTCSSHAWATRAAGSTTHWRRSGSRARSWRWWAASRPRWPSPARQTSSRASPRGTPPGCAAGW